MGNIHSADDVYKFKREALKKVYAIKPKKDLLN